MTRNKFPSNKLYLSPSLSLLLKSLFLGSGEQALATLDREKPQVDPAGQDESSSETTTEAREGDSVVVVVVAFLALVDGL